MSQPVKILLQTTIPSLGDDWSINRFSLLRHHLSSLKDDKGRALYNVTARDLLCSIAQTAKFFVTPL